MRSATNRIMQDFTCSI